jgi:predicted nucleic acid-binding protein
LILVDSSVWIDFLSSSPGPAGRELRRLIAAAEPLALTGIVLTEILQGITRDIAQIEQLLSMWELLEPTGVSTYRETAAIFRLARAKGITIATVDALIAAIAIEYRAAVFTLDKDFSQIARLTNLHLYKFRQPSA